HEIGRKVIGPHVAEHSLLWMCASYGRANRFDDDGLSHDVLLGIEPQRHRGTEKTQTRFVDFALCFLCASVSLWFFFFISPTPATPCTPILPELCTSPASPTTTAKRT